MGIKRTPAFILGHRFRPMTSQDFIGFAGAEDGDLICENGQGDTVLIAHQIGGGDTEGDDLWEVHEIRPEWERTWRVVA